MNGLNYFRCLIIMVVFGLVGWLGPDFMKWGLLGYTLMLITIKIEEDTKR